MIKIKSIITRKSNNFGDLTVIFIGDDGKCYATSTHEGDHASLAIGKEVASAQELIPDHKGVVTLRDFSYDIVYELSALSKEFNHKVWSYFVCLTLDCNQDHAKRVVDVLERVVKHEGFIRTPLWDTVNPIGTEDKIIVRVIDQAIYDPDYLKNKEEEVFDGRWINFYKELLLRVGI